MYSFSKIKITLTSWSIIFVAAFIISVFFVFDGWKQNRITIDAPSYYAYLPSTFIYQDLKLDYVDKDPTFFKDKLWYYRITDGNRVIKHPMGISVALFPFFMIGHVLAPVSGYPQDGFSLPYQNAMSIGVIIYLILGLHFLRKVLLNYFSEKIVALTIISIAIGTNLLWYVTFEGLMSHGISFSLLCICLYNFHTWLKKGISKYLILFSVCFGLVILIRPLSVLIAFYFLLLAVITKGGLKNFILTVKTSFPTVVLSAAIIFLIFFPQMLYWKYTTGYWFFNTYIDEHFYFKNPETFRFLLSFQKGWLIYTPVMWLAVFGMIRLYRISRAYFVATLLYITLVIFIFSSWWDWSFGYCFGERMMIDSYSMLSFPMAAAFSFLLSKKKILSITIYLFVSLLIFLNLFQTWQYKNGLIHYDYMTREAYFKGFFQTEASREWYDLLKPYDFLRREMGLPQIEYTKEFLKNIKPEDMIYLRGYDLNFFSVNNPRFILTCTSSDIRDGEIFHLLHLDGDTVAIKSSNGKYLSLKPYNRNIIAADMDIVTSTEKFIFIQIEENDNKITLQSLNGKFLSVISGTNDLIGATSEINSVNATFRIYLLENK